MSDDIDQYAPTQALLDVPDLSGYNLPDLGLDDDVPIPAAPAPQAQAGGDTTRAFSADEAAALFAEPSAEPPAQAPDQPPAQPPPRGPMQSAGAFGAQVGAPPSSQQGAQQAPPSAPSQPFAPMGQPPPGAQPHAGQPYGGQPQALQPQGGQPQAGQPQAGQPQAGQPYAPPSQPGLAQSSPYGQPPNAIAQGAPPPRAPMMSIGAIEIPPQPETMSDSARLLLVFLGVGIVFALVFAAAALLVGA